MATYKDIRNFVKEKYGFYPQPCWIAHMKEVCGIPVRVAHNRFSLSKREWPCPPNKMEAIKDAFVHFKMM